MQFTYGDVVQHISDPHGRPRGIVVRQADEHGIVKVKWFGVGEPDDWEEPVHETEIRLRAIPETPDVGEATRLLGFALFNHAKGNTEATETLMRKAYKALTGREWNE